MFAKVARIIVSLGISIIPLLYVAGYLSFIPGLPTPSSLFGGPLFGSGAGSSSGTSPFAIGTGLGSIVPYGAFGISGLIIFTVLSRLGSSVSSAVSAPRVPNLNSMPGLANMMSMGSSQFGGIPEVLPQDLSKSEYVILRMIRNGQN